MSTPPAGRDRVTHTLEVPGASLVYDVHGPLPTADGRPPLLMIGQPMTAEGFTALARLTPERTVVTYDPRGLGRSTRTDGRTDHDPVQHATDLHALVAALDAGPVEMLGSSGGAVDGLALVQHHPEDVAVLVAHEPPLVRLLPDQEHVQRAQRWISDAYQADGFAAGMVRFMAFTSWQGELTDALFEQPLPDPAAMGLPTEDDGRRDDPLLSDASDAVAGFRPDLDALAESPVRIVVAAGEESARQVPGRAAEQLASRLGVPLTLFPSHHGGFLDGSFGWAGKPEEFAARLREVLADGRAR